MISRLFKKSNILIKESIFNEIGQIKIIVFAAAYAFVRRKAGYKDIRQGISYNNNKKPETL